ncbi:MAG: GNAT family N-acetyltransferase, partial [Chloroflexota bacterium]
VIVVDGKDAGFLVVERPPHETFLSKIMLLPAHQGRGIGADLVRDLIAESHAAGKPVRLRVLKGNPAKSLYERLGFVVIEEHDVRYIMRCDPPT